MLRLRVAFLFQLHQSPVEVVKIMDQQTIQDRPTVALEPIILFIIIIIFFKEKPAVMEPIKSALLDHIILFHLVLK